METQQPERPTLQQVQDALKGYAHMNAERAGNDFFRPLMARALSPLVLVELQMFINGYDQYPSVDLTPKLKSAALKIASLAKTHFDASDDFMDKLATAIIEFMASQHARSEIFEDTSPMPGLPQEPDTTTKGNIKGLLE